MHSEYYQVTQEAADIINDTKKRGGRVICRWYHQHTYTGIRGG